MQIERTQQTGRIYRRWCQYGLILIALSLQCVISSSTGTGKKSPPMVAPPCDSPFIRRFRDMVVKPRRNSIWENPIQKNVKPNRKERKNKRRQKRRDSTISSSSIGLFMPEQCERSDAEISRSGGSSQYKNSFTYRLGEFKRFMDGHYDFTAEEGKKNKRRLQQTYQTFTVGKDPKLCVAEFYHCAEAILKHYHDNDSRRCNLTDEQTQSLFAAIFKARMLTWVIYRKDQDDKSEGHFERIICAYKAYKKGSNTGIPYMEYMNVRSNTECDDMVFGKLTEGLLANHFNTFKSLMDDPEVKQIFQKHTGRFQ